MEWSQNVAMDMCAASRLHSQPTRGDGVRCDVMTGVMLCGVRCDVMSGAML